MKHAVLLSGVYDLRPLLLTTLNEPLKLSEEDAARLNDALYESIKLSSTTPVVKPGAHDAQSVKPGSHNEQSVKPGAHDAQNVKPGIHVCVGEAESPWFVQESERFFQRVGGCSCHVIPGHDHFSIVESLCDEKEYLTSIVLNLLNG